jgi:hypothetical protein
MLSQLLNMHPDVLSLSEFWNIFSHKDVRIEWPAGNAPPKFTSVPACVMSGKDFWRQITAFDSDMDDLFVAGMSQEDAVPLGRFDPAAGLPAVCRVLAPLADDLDALYDELALAVPTWPRRPVEEHCRVLFARLATMLGRSAIVERTGGSTKFMHVLRQQFPEARFVFLQRDGADSVLSMNRHPMFRLGAIRAVANAVAHPSGSRLAELAADGSQVGRTEDFAGLIAPRLIPNGSWRTRSR